MNEKLLQVYPNSLPVPVVDTYIHRKEAYNRRSRTEVIDVLIPQL